VARLLTRTLVLALAGLTLPADAAAQGPPAPDPGLASAVRAQIEVGRASWYRLELTDQLRVMSAMSGWLDPATLDGLISTVPARTGGRSADPELDMIRDLHFQAAAELFVELEGRIDDTTRWPEGLSAPDPAAVARALLAFIEEEYQAAMERGESPAQVLDLTSVILAWTEGLLEPRSTLFAGSVERIMAALRLPDPPPAVASGQDPAPSGLWIDENGTRYRVRRVGDEIFWTSEGGLRGPSVFHGTIAGDLIVGEWMGMPGPGPQDAGALSLRIQSSDRMQRAGESRPYGASVWTRDAGATSGPGAPLPGAAPSPSGAAPLPGAASVEAFTAAIAEAAWVSDAVPPPPPPPVPFPDSSADIGPGAFGDRAADGVAPDWASTLRITELDARPVPIPNGICGAQQLELTVEVTNVGDVAIDPPGLDETFDVRFVISNAVPGWTPRDRPTADRLEPLFERAFVHVPRRNRGGAAGGGLYAGAAERLGPRESIRRTVYSQMPNPVPFTVRAELAAGERLFMRGGSAAKVDEASRQVSFPASQLRIEYTALWADSLNPNLYDAAGVVVANWGDAPTQGPLELNFWVPKLDGFDAGTFSFRPEEIALRWSLDLEPLPARSYGIAKLPMTIRPIGGATPAWDFWYASVAECGPEGDLRDNYQIARGSFDKSPYFATMRRVAELTIAFVRERE